MEIIIAKNTIVPTTTPAMLAPVQVRQSEEQSPPSQHSSPVPQSKSTEQKTQVFLHTLSEQQDWSSRHSPSLLQIVALPKAKKQRITTQIVRSSAIICHLPDCWLNVLRTHCNPRTLGGEGGGLGCIFTSLSSSNSKSVFLSKVPLIVEISLVPSYQSQKYPLFLGGPHLILRSYHTFTELRWPPLKTLLYYLLL